MEFEQYLIANGFDPATLNAAQKTALQTAWRASQKPPTLPVATVIPDTPSAPQQPQDYQQKVAAIEAEANRQHAIREAGFKVLENHRGNPEKVGQIRELIDAACADTKTDIRAFELSLLKLDRYSGPMVFAPSQPVVTDSVVEAAICMTHKLPDVEQRFSEQTLDAASKRFRGGMTLNGLVSLAARQAGYRGDIGGNGNLLAMWQHANRHRQGGFEPMAAGTGLSTLDITGILSNTANKFLAAQFLYGEQSWRRISKIKTATDFKQMTTYRLTGTNKFIKVPPGGEIKHGTLSELSYTNQIDTYGILIGMDRRDFINDDLGAVTGRASEIGMGAIDSLNEVFWTEILSNPTGTDGYAFFSTDHSNYDDGATDSVLSLAGLENADTIFGIQTKPNGTPLGAQPRILLVPRALRNTAMNLMADAITASAQSTATLTVANTWKGMFEVVDSVYLQSSAITGYSSTAWYLFADPNNIPVMEVAFLYGKDMPTIEESELEFDRLGMSMRAYLDWGCNLQEYRGAVKLKGAA